MQGDATDISSRLRSLLPFGWFSDLSPNIDALLTCIATPWAWFYQLTQYVAQQTRLHTASDQWLDLIAYDFLGSTLPREPAEADASYRGRIEWALVQEAATRGAISANMQWLTGFQPRIFEPANIADTGAYGNRSSGTVGSFHGMAYAEAGGWGSLSLPLQFFIDVRRPVITGLSLLAGYGTGGGGYGVGRLGYIDLGLLLGTITDADIALSLNRLLPVNTTAWLRLS